MRLIHSFRTFNSLPKVVFFAAGDTPKQWVEKKEGAVQSTEKAQQWGEKVPEKVAALQSKYETLKTEVSEEAKKEREHLKAMIEAEITEIMLDLQGKENADMPAKTVTATEGKEGVFALIKKNVPGIFPTKEAIQLAFNHTMRETKGQINVLLPGDIVSMENGVLTVKDQFGTLRYETTLYPWGQEKSELPPILDPAPSLPDATVVDHFEGISAQNTNKNSVDAAEPAAEPAAEYNDRQVFIDAMNTDWKTISKGMVPPRGVVINDQPNGINGLSHKITLEKDDKRVTFYVTKMYGDFKGEPKYNSNSEHVDIHYKGDRFGRVEDAFSAALKDLEEKAATANTRTDRQQDGDQKAEAQADRQDQAAQRATEKAEAQKKSLDELLAIFNLKNATDITGIKVTEMAPESSIVLKEGEKGEIGGFDLDLYRITERGIAGAITMDGHYITVLLGKDGNVTMEEHYYDTVDKTYDPEVRAQYVGTSKAEILAYLKGFVKADEEAKKSENPTKEELKEREAQEKAEREGLTTKLSELYLEELKKQIPVYREAEQIRDITPEDVENLAIKIKLTPDKEKPWLVTVDADLTYYMQYMTTRLEGSYRYDDLKSDSQSQSILVKNLILSTLAMLDSGTPQKKAAAEAGSEAEFDASETKESLSLRLESLYLEKLRREIIFSTDGSLLPQDVEDVKIGIKLTDNPQDPKKIDITYTLTYKDDIVVENAGYGSDTLARLGDTGEQTALINGLIGETIPLIEKKIPKDPVDTPTELGGLASGLQNELVRKIKSNIEDLKTAGFMNLDGGNTEEAKKLTLEDLESFSARMKLIPLRNGLILPTVIFTYKGVTSEANYGGIKAEDLENISSEARKDFIRLVAGEAMTIMEQEK